MGFLFGLSEFGICQTTEWIRGAGMTANVSITWLAQVKLFAYQVGTVRVNRVTSDQHGYFVAIWANWIDLFHGKLFVKSDQQIINRVFRLRWCGGGRQTWHGTFFQPVSPKH